MIPTPVLRAKSNRRANSWECRNLHNQPAGLHTSRKQRIALAFLSEDFAHPPNKKVAGTFMPATSSRETPIDEAQPGVPNRLLRYAFTRLRD
jgi:hypothetical protein